MKTVELLPYFLVRLFLFSLFFVPLLNASTLYLSISTNPSKLNPILAGDAGSSEISSKIFSGLLKYDKDGNIVTDLAKSYDFVDEKTLLFTLRDDVLWHDGAKFSAKDVVFTYKTITSPKIFSPYSSSYTKIESVEALDEYRVKVVYKEPYFRALEIWLVSLIPEHILKDEEEIMTSSFNTKPIGTGPYTLKNLSYSQNVELEAFKDYYDGEPKIKNISYRFTPDRASEFMLLRKGELDVGSLTPLQYTRQIDLDFEKRFKIYELIGHSYGYMGFNLKKEKFKSLKLRQALAMLVNREELIDIMAFGYGDIVNGPFLKGAIGYNKDIKLPDYNPKKAIEILNSLGYNKQNPLTFQIAVPSSGSGKQIAQIIQYMFSFAPIEVSIRAVEWQAFLNTIVEPRDFDALIMAWSLALFPNPETLWHSSSDKKGGFNFIGYKNQKVDSLIEESMKIVDRDVLDKKLQEIYKLISQDIPYIFLYSSKNLVASKKNIQNIEPSIIGIEHNLIEWEKP
ncbi:MAG: peptide-binding protein [Campylobacterales bacterium]